MNTHPKKASPAEGNASAGLLPGDHIHIFYENEHEFSVGGEDRMRVICVVWWSPTDRIYKNMYECLIHPPNPPVVAVINLS